MPANVPSLLLLPLYLTQEKKIAEMKLWRSCSAFFPAARRQCHMANELCSGLFGVELCPLGESQPCANPVAVDLNEAMPSHLTEQPRGPQDLPRGGKIKCLG